MDADFVAQTRLDAGLKFRFVRRDSSGSRSKPTDSENTAVPQKQFSDQNNIPI